MRTKWKAQLDKKEIVLSCTNDSYAIDCTQKESTDYFITLIPTLKSTSQVHIQLAHASKKIVLKVDVRNEHSDCNITIFIKAEQNAHHVLEIYQEHTAFHTSSACRIKGILYDTSSITYTGLITLKKDSINATAEQTSKFLVMSETASVKSVPSLQVHHNQVQCGHATTVSYIDPLVMWYAAQRGIASEIIEHMIQEVFLK